MNDKIANPAPLGFFGLAIFAWMASMSYAGWFGPEALNSDVGQASLYFGGLAMMLAAIFEFLRGRGFNAVLFATMGFFAWVWTTAAGNAPGGDPAYGGWFDLFWTVFFAGFWLGSFKRPPAVMLLVLAIAVTFFFHMISGFGVTGLRIVGGYVGLAVGVLALYVAVAEVMAAGGGMTLPATGESGGGGASSSF